MTNTKKFWNPSLATKLLTTLFILPVALPAPQAEAMDYREGTIAGYRAEILDSGSYSGEDYIEVYGPNGKEQILVTCAPFDWSSTGPNSVTFANHIAESWCF